LKRILIKGETAWEIIFLKGFLYHSFKGLLGFGFLLGRNFLFSKRKEGSNPFQHSYYFLGKEQIIKVIWTGIPNSWVINFQLFLIPIYFPFIIRFLPIPLVVGKEWGVGPKLRKIPKFQPNFRIPLIPGIP